MQSHKMQQPIREASGEELLLMAVFGGDTGKSIVDRELDRRARQRVRFERRWRQTTAVTACAA